MDAQQIAPEKPTANWESFTRAQQREAQLKVLDEDGEEIGANNPRCNRCNPVATLEK